MLGILPAIKAQKPARIAATIAPKKAKPGHRRAGKSSSKKLSFAHLPGFNPNALPADVPTRRDHARGWDRAFADATGGARPRITTSRAVARSWDAAFARVRGA